MSKKQYAIPGDMEVYRPGNGGTPESALDRENGHREGEWYRDFRNFEGGDRFKQVLTIPDVADFAGVVARSVLQNPRKMAAAVRLWYRHEKFGDEAHQEMLRIYLAASVGIGGRGRVDGVFSTVGMLAPDMYRTVSGLPRHKKGDEERVVRNSDFRREERPVEGLAGK